MSEKAPGNKTWIKAARFAGLIVLMIMLFRWFEHSQVYHPGRVLEATPEAGSYEDLFLPVDRHQINCWFFGASPSASEARKQLVFLMAHGNGGNISHRLQHVKIFQELGVNVLLFDYRGFGKSSGKAGEEATYQDGQAAWRWLRDTKNFAPENIILFGESLGGGICSELALREKIGGLILQSTFTSIPAMGKELFPWLPVDLISTIGYKTVSKLPDIKVPVLIMHSRADTLVRFHHAEKNYAVAGDPKLFWEIAGDHNYAIESDPEKFFQGLETFLTKLLKK